MLRGVEASEKQEGALSLTYMTGSECMQVWSVSAFPNVVSLTFREGTSRLQFTPSVFTIGHGALWGGAQTKVPPPTTHACCSCLR